MPKLRTLNVKKLSGFASALTKVGFSTEFAKAFDIAIAQDDIFDFDDFDNNFLDPFDGFGEDPELDAQLSITVKDTVVPLQPTSEKTRQESQTELETKEAQNIQDRFDETEGIDQDELEDFAREQELNTRLLIYQTQQDSKVDDLICLPLQGEVFELDDPTRPIIPDSTHPNCRCFWEDAETGDFLGQDGQFASGSIATAVKEDGKEGQWRTVNGTPVFFPDGADEKDVINKAFESKKAEPKAPKEPAPQEPVDFGTVRKQYQEKLSELKDKEGFSFNPNSGKTTDAFDEKQATRFFDDHSKNGEPVYVISKTNNVGGLNRRSESAYSQIVNEGNTPLIGRWKDPDTNFEYTDVSFPVSGISEGEAKGLLKRNAQESALVISKGGKVSFVNG